jgi:colanic acid/amylovoran biosynthesis protein
VRFLITNSVPLNGGDEALLRATIAFLTDEFPNCHIKVLCKDVESCRRYCPDLELGSDLEFVRPSTVASRLVLKARGILHELVCFPIAPRISFASLNKEERGIIDDYNFADLVISSAGGFLHDYYDIRQRLIGFEMALSLGKRVVIIGQSIGPFWKWRSMRLVRRALGRLDAILLRENHSLGHLRDSRVDQSRVFVSTDIAFYWRRMAPELYIAKRGPVRRIALSFRDWHSDGVSVETIVQRAAELCRHLLNRSADIDLVFVSTCQGVPHYADDSAVAKKIVRALPAMLQSRCAIDQRRYAPDRLIWRYSQMDAYIGMRLHGAILAMLGGTAAMAIAYEDKTPGIFATLGLEQFQVDHRQGAKRWISCAEVFMRCIDDIRVKLPTLLDAAAATLELNKRVLADVVSNRSENET